LTLYTFRAALSEQKLMYWPTFSVYPQIWAHGKAGLEMEMEMEMEKEMEMEN